MGWIEAIATLFGVLCVLLLIKRVIWAWPIGLVQVVLFAWIFFQVKLYSDMVLHLIYVVLQGWGWYHWLHGGKDDQALPMTRLTARALGWWGLIALAAAAVWGYGMQRWTDASMVYPDAFVATASLVAQWLLTRKVLETWIFWIVVDVVAIWIYLAKQLYFTSGLYSLFLVMAIAGYIEWRRAWKRESTVSPNTVGASAPGAARL